MTKQVQLRRGTTAEHAVFTGAEGELTIDTTLDIAVVHDGVTVGGRPLVGAAATQQILNKTGVGIGTSSLSVEFELVGDADIEGQITARGLTVRYQSPIVRVGFVSATSGTQITGIATNNIRVGHSVTGTYVGGGTTVTSLGIGTVFIFPPTTDFVGTSTGTFLTDGGTTIVGVDTSSAVVGYGISGTGVLSGTTISSIIVDGIVISQNSSGTLGITTRTGSVATIGDSIITGVTTTSLQIGDQISNEFLPGYGTTIVSIGSNTITASNGINTTGSNTFTFTRIVDLQFINLGFSTTFLFNDINSGLISVDVLQGNNVAVSTLTVSYPVADITLTNTTIGTANISNLSGTDVNIATQNTNISKINAGIITSAGISTAVVNDLKANSGVITSLVSEYLNFTTPIPYTTAIGSTEGTFVGVNTDRIAITTTSINNSAAAILVNDQVSASFITTTTTVQSIGTGFIVITPASSSPIGIATTTVDIIRPITPTSGIATIPVGVVSTLYSNDVFFNVGIGTTIGVSNGLVDNLYYTNGIGTEAVIGTARVSDLFFNVGIGTSLSVTGFTSITQLYSPNATIDYLVASEITGINTLSVNTGIVTNLSILNRIEASDQLSYTYSGTLSVASTTVISGISTNGLLSQYTVIGEGINENTYILSIGSSTVTLNTPAINVGVSTTDFTFRDGNTGINTIPVIKGRNLNYSGISTLNQTNITSGSITSFTASRMDMSSGIATVGTLNVATGIITTLTATTISASNVTVGVGNTNLIVNGDARITGVLTVGGGSVTLSGNDSSVYGISTVSATSGIITTLTGTEVSYTNISVGSTLSFVGVNTFTSLDQTVQFRLSNSGIATNYTLTLPPNRGRDGMSLTVDATGNLGFSTNPGGLYENRIYVSSANGNDADDGKTKPVQTIKRAAQLASFESFVLPDNRFIDGANRLEANRTFIMDQVVGFVTFAYPGITTSPGWDRAICARDVGLIVDAVAYDLTYNGNSKTRAAGLSYIVGVGTTTYVDGEKTETIAGIKHIFEMSKFLINNVAITTSNLNLYPIGIAQTSFQSFDNTILYDEECNPTGYSTACCANVQSSIVNLVGIVTSIIGIGTTAAPALTLPTSKSNPVAIIVEAGEYVEDNPIILYEDVAVLGDNLRNTIIRPSNAGKDLFRVRNGIYLTGFAMKDYVDAAGVPQYTWDYACAFDDPLDSTTSRTGYAIKTNKPIITRSPYIQNCSILSFLGANGMKVDGSKVDTPNIPIIPAEAEVDPDLSQPEQGKSMVAAAFTMVSFGGVGWRVFNDGYSQVVSCFQIFCKYGSLAQSGGYLSITNSATNFGRYALRSTGFSKSSFIFDRGVISATGTSGGLATLKVVGLGRSDQDLYVLRFFDNTLIDRTINFKPVVTTEEIDGATDVNTANNQITSVGHGFINGDSVIYFGDDQSVPPRIIGGLVPDNQYWIGYIDANTFKLYEDDSITNVVDLTATSTGIHTFQKNAQEFFAKEVLEAHNTYQRIGIASTSSTLKFVSGRQISQTVVGGTAIGIAYTYYPTTRELIVSIEPSSGVRRNFQVTNGSTNLSILDHNNTPISIAVTSVAGLTTYWTSNFTVDSTVPGTPITGISTLPENYRLHFHRPSIINSSSHTWEYSGSGIDYNALPQNGGKTVPSSEQTSELGGRVFTSGTNELGDFKIGDFITAFNRTGNIVFNNTVTIGTLDSIRLSLSGGTPISEFSSDIGLGDNELGGPLNSRVSTQLAVRSFLNNRLGSFIDKSVSTNAVPGAVVQLNSIGQINADLIPPKVTNFYRATSDDGRTQLVNFIPAINLLSGDTVVEPTNAYVLVNDVIGQFLILNNSTVYNFLNGDIVYGTVSQAGAVGVVTAPPAIGINTTILSFPNVGYGTTGLVRGVPLSLKELNGGSGYNSAGIYTGVRFDTASGIGTGITGTITVSAGGTVSQVAINTGGFKFAVDDILTLNDPAPIGGRTGGANFQVKISSVETRLYLALTNNQKFQGSVSLPDYIQDRNAVAISTNVGVAHTYTFTPTDIGVGGDIDFTNDRVAIGTNTFGNGDAVIYSNNGGTTLEELVDGNTYYVKRVGISSVELYTTYALSTKIDFTSSGTGTHKLTRPGINTSSNQITFVNHGLSNGDPVRVAIGSITTVLPTGITTDAFYFVGSATTNTFSLHETRADSLLSANGLLYNPIDITSEGSGIVSFTEQNITYTSSVNTSSSDINNWTLLASNDIDAANIISGTVSPSRLASGTANTQTFLRGDSNWSKVVTSVGFGTTQPVGVNYTSAELAPGGIGINTYYGNVQITLNRVESTLDTYSTLGIAKFKNSTFSIGEDGAIQIKNAAGGGDIDAVTLSGNNGAYYLDVTNHTGTIPISRGGTGLSGLPSNGAFLVGNGSSYNLTTTPTFSGDATFNGGAGAITLSANSDITFTNSGTWSGDTNGKIQYFGNSLYMTFATSLILRVGASNVVTFDSAGSLTLNGAITASSTIQGTRLISTIATGTAPLTVSSTTQVTNLNANFLNGLSSTSANTASTIVARDGSGNFNAGTITATLIGNVTGNLTGNITNTVTGTNSTELVRGNMANNDNFRILIGGTASDDGFVEIATADNGNEPIHVRQYSGPFTTLTRTATLLDGSGNTSFPGTVTSSSTVQGTRLISTIGTGTAPLTVSSTTVVANLNASFLEGYATATANTGNTIVRRDASGNFSAGTITAGLIDGPVRSLRFFDTRAVVTTPQSWNADTNGVRFDFKENSANGLSDGGTYNGVMYWRKYGSSTDWSGGGAIELATTDNARLWLRYGTTTSWGAWKRVIFGDGFDNSTTITGTRLISNIATGTAPLTVTSTTTVSNLRAQYVTFGMLDNNDDYVNFRVMRNNNSSSLRDGMYIGYGNANSGDTRLYGGGNTGSPVTISSGGTLTASGNLTANSDISLKKNIVTIENALDKVLNLRGVEFDRIDIEDHQIGVIAQEIEQVIPEVVKVGEKGIKSVAYGNMVAVLIEAIKEQNKIIMELKLEIENLKLK